ncbi:Alpha/Beta hydrolase protein [Xylariaceae sp. FL0594]|nr:Alpha/Beta hydrolase protein [Xylariaceae sp. FL0594]
MLLPKEPSFSFALPSVHDGARLQCRVYHPPCLSLFSEQQDETCLDAKEKGTGNGSGRWRGHAAVVAHPYAPLGGCYDDAVVDVLAGTLLGLGFVVATFNFRGAGQSHGRTSWTAKPEQGDYMSVVGFVACYVRYLASSLSSSSSSRPSSSSSSQKRRSSSSAKEEQQKKEEEEEPVVCLAGYSYGALITTRVPPLQEILARFTTPPVHSLEADVRLRAQHLAWVQGELLRGSVDRRAQGARYGDGDDGMKKGKRRSSSFRGFGGGFGSAGVNHHHNHQMKEEWIQKSVRDLLERAKRVRVRKEEEEDVEVQECLHPEGITFRSAYIVVSPPVGLVSRLATLSLFSPTTPSSSIAAWFSRRSRSRTQEHEHAADATTSLSAEEHTTTDDKFTTSPTLVVYGDRDGFISQRRMREWTRQLSLTHTHTQIRTRRERDDGQRESPSRFRYVEVPGAGHFWAEGDCVWKLRDAIGIFATEITS